MLRVTINFIHIVEWRGLNEKRYETPEIEVVEFETEDIMTVSGDTPFVPAGQ